jgi:hypothetical protein
MADETSEIVLSKQDLREVSRYAAESAQDVLEIFERAHPADSRPRDAIDAAWTFARGGERGKALRDTGWAAHNAARDADTAAAGDAARAAMCAASAAYLHPLADAHQVKHILGQRPTRRERPNFWRAMIELSVLLTLSRLAGARRQSSLTCSAATPRHRLVEGASGSFFASGVGGEDLPVGPLGLQGAVVALHLHEHGRRERLRRAGVGPGIPNGAVSA